MPGAAADGASGEIGGMGVSAGELGMTFTNHRPIPTSKQVKQNCEYLTWSFAEEWMHGLGARRHVSIGSCNLHEILRSETWLSCSLASCHVQTIFRGHILQDAIHVKFCEVAIGR